MLVHDTYILFNFVDVRIQNLKVRVSHLEYRLHCVEAAAINNTALAWPNCSAMGSQMAPAFYPPILHANNNQMASTPPTYMPLSAGVTRILKFHP